MLHRRPTVNISPLKPPNAPTSAPMLESAATPDVLSPPAPSADGARRAAGLLAALGAASAAVYLLRLSLPMSLRDYLGSPLIDLPKLIGETNVGAWYYLDTMLALFGLYLAGYWVVLRLTRQASADSRVSMRQLGAVIVTFFGVFSAILLLMFPVTAADVFNYMLYARMWVLQGLNPYVVPPEQVASDLTLDYTIFRNLTTAYGPGFTQLSAVLVRLAGEDLLRLLLVFKLALIGFHAASVWLVYLTVRRIEPAYAWAGAYLMAWNPLVLFNVAGDGHNDITMLALVLLAFYLVARRRWTLALTALVLSATMKWLSVLLIPMFLVGGLRALGRRGIVPLVSGLLFGLGIAALLFAPFYTTPEHAYASLLGFGSLFTTSIGTVLRDALMDVVGEDAAVRWARWTMYLVFGVFYVWEMTRVRGTFMSLAYASFQAFFLYLVFGGLWFQPWYVTWLVGIGALLVGTRVANRMILFTFTAMLAHVVTGFGWRVGWFESYKPYLRLAAVSLVFAAPLIAWLAERDPLRRPPGAGDSQT